MNESAGRKQRDSRRRCRARPESWWWIATVVLVPVVAFTVISWVLLAVTTHPHQPGDEIDLAKTALSVGAGTGGVVALILAGRRQWHNEQSSRATERDAAERRITELYTKAVDQLGSEKAPVRLGGLYALERLAEDNANQRETIVNVICAYLRMSLPIELEPGDDEYPMSEFHEDQVRLAAQEILTRHLAPISESGELLERYWPGIYLNLAGATLSNVNFRLCHLKGANFSATKFSGNAAFDGASFAEGVVFDHASFEKSASMTNVEFNQEASFTGTRFQGSSLFTGARFRGSATFISVAFMSEAIFFGAQFRSTEFRAATFKRRAEFDGAKFNQPVNFEDCLFNLIASFQRANFSKSAMFWNTVFNDRAFFQDAKFEDDELGFSVSPPAISLYADRKICCWVRRNTQGPSRSAWPAGCLEIGTDEKPLIAQNHGDWNILINPNQKP